MVEPVIGSDAKPIRPSSIPIPEIFMQNQDHIFTLRSLALVWTLFYSDKIEPKIIDELRVVSYSEVHDNKCVLIESHNPPVRTYEVTYVAETQHTHVVSYIEQDRYVFEADELPED